MMRARTLLQAIHDTLRQEMTRDDTIVLLGEDVGELGGVFQVTEGLQEEFGPQRVLDTAAAEGGIVGTAVGMALYGLRPVPEIQFADFLWPGFDQIVSEMARIRYRSGGQYRCPVVLRVPYGGGVGGGMYQSASPEAFLAHVPGLVVVCPSSPEDAAGLLRAALRGEDPVVFLEPKRLYRQPGERGEPGDSGEPGEPGGPGENFREDDPPHDTVAIGAARIRRQGTDVTVLTYGGMVPVALEAAEQAAAGGIQAEVVDLRTLVPVDIATVLASIVKTGRAVLVSEAPRFGGYTGELSAILAERAILHLEAPVVRVAAFDTPIPRILEDVHLPDTRRVLAALERVANF